MASHIPKELIPKLIEIRLEDRKFIDPESEEFKSKLHRIIEEAPKTSNEVTMPKETMDLSFSLGIERLYRAKIEDNKPGNYGSDEINKRYMIYRQEVGAFAEIGFAAYCGVDFDPRIGTYRTIGDVAIICQVRYTDGDNLIFRPGLDKEDDFFVLVTMRKEGDKTVAIIHGGAYGRDIIRLGKLDAPDPTRKPCYCLKKDQLPCSPECCRKQLRDGTFGPVTILPLF